MPNLLIAFEGNCKVGKSTVTKALAEKFGIEGIPFLLNKGALSKNEIGQKFKSIEGVLPLNTADPLYIADLLFQSKTVIEPALAEGKNVIQDRHWWSIAAFSAAVTKEHRLGAYDIKPQISHLIDLGALREPDMVVYLETDRETLIERLRASPSHLHDMYLRSPLILDTIAEAYSTLMEDAGRRGIEVLKLNTSKLNLEETTREVFNAIAKKISFDQTSAEPTL